VPCVTNRDREGAGALPLPNRDREGAGALPLPNRDREGAGALPLPNRDREGAGALPLPNRDREGAVPCRYRTATVREPVHSGIIVTACSSAERKLHEPTFTERIDGLRKLGFSTSPAGPGKAQITRDGIEP